MRRVVAGSLALLLLARPALASPPPPPGYVPPVAAVNLRAPLPSDDSAHGYAVGNLWNAPQGMFVAQQVSFGQAVWTALATTALPVDAVGGAAPVAAYGTVKLRAAYTGQALNVVRASDGTALDVGFLATGALDTASLDAFCALTTCTVATWYDQSGNGYNATQATAANRPSVNSTSLTGNARSIVFDSNINSSPTIQKWMTLPAGVAATGNAVSVFEVGRAYSSERPAIYTQLTNANYPQTLSSGLYSANGTTKVLSFNYGGADNGPSYTNTAGVIAASQSSEFVGYVSSSSASTVFNGPNSVGYGAQVGQALAGGFLGTTAANMTSGATGYVEMAAVVVYARALTTTAEVPALRASLTRALGLAPQVRDVWAVDGDSITEGYQSTFLANRPRQAQALLTKPMRVFDKGFFGDTLAHRGTNYAADVAPLFNPAATNNVLEIFAGTNDLAVNNVTDVQLEGYLTSYCQSAHSTGWRVVVATILPRSAFTTAQENYRQAFNTWLRANWPTIADGLADYAADPTMGATAATSNTAFYPDGTHPSSLGYGYLAQIEAAAANALLH